MNANSKKNIHHKGAKSAKGRNIIYHEGREGKDEGKTRKTKDCRVYYSQINYNKVFTLNFPL